jgi:hypothetical protein
MRNETKPSAVHGARKSCKNKKFCEELIAYFPWYDTCHIENDASKNSSIVACVFLYRRKVSTEPLPGNDRGNFTEPLPSNDRGNFTESLPSNDRGNFTEPLPSNDKRNFTESLPSNDKRNFTESLPSNDRGNMTEPLASNDRGILPSRCQATIGGYTYRQIGGIF